MNEVIKVSNNRVSLRRYKQKEVDSASLDIIIESMKRAPTAGNMQMYSIILVKDSSIKQRLSVTCDNQKFIANAPVVMLIFADLQKWFDYYQLEGCEEYCKRHNLEYSTPQMSDLMIAIEDSMCAAQNGVIAAESLGIGSCYIGDIMESYEIHKEMLELPDFVFPIAMLTMGYYPDDFKKTQISRFDNEFMVFENKYYRLDESSLKKMFANREKRFTENNIYEADNFAQMFYARKTNSEFSREMVRSVKEILKNWDGKMKTNS